MRRRQRKATPPFPPYFVFKRNVTLADGTKYFAGNCIPQDRLIKRNGDSMSFNLRSHPDKSTIIPASAFAFVDHEGVRHDV